MGAEAFGISMQFVELDVWACVTDILATYRQIRMGDRSVSGGYATVLGEYIDDAHIIELQLSHHIPSDKCTLAVRFSLCSFDSIDTIFIALISNILSSLDADVWLMSSAIKHKSNYLPGDSRWLIAALPDEIAQMRNYWQGLFGSKQGAVRVKDSFAFIGMVHK